MLFLFSLGVILAALGVAAWLISTGQTAYIDGLFLLICCLVLVLAFGLYIRYLIKTVMQTDAPPAGPAKFTTTTQETPVPPAQVPAMQSAGKEGESARVLERR
jgi:putative copper export protein